MYSGDLFSSSQMYPGDQEEWEIKRKNCRLQQQRSCAPSKIVFFFFLIFPAAEYRILSYNGSKIVFLFWSFPQQLHKRLMCAPSNTAQGRSLLPSQCILVFWYFCSSSSCVLHRTLSRAASLCSAQQPGGGVHLH